MGFSKMEHIVLVPVLSPEEERQYNNDREAFMKVMCQQQWFDNPDRVRNHRTHPSFVILHCAGVLDC